MISVLSNENFTSTSSVRYNIPHTTTSMSFEAASPKRKKFPRFRHIPENPRKLTIKAPKQYHNAKEVSQVYGYIKTSPEN
jgi:hypothetical protein